MSQAQAAQYGSEELSRRFKELTDHVHKSLPSGAARNTVVQGLLSLRVSALAALND